MPIRWFNLLTHLNNFIYVEMGFNTAKCKLIHFVCKIDGQILFQWVKKLREISKSSPPLVGYQISGIESNLVIQNADQNACFKSEGDLSWI